MLSTIHAKRVIAALVTVAVWLASYTAGHFIHDAGKQGALARRQGRQLVQKDREIDRYKETIRVLRTAAIVTNTLTPGPVQLVFTSPSQPTTTTTRPAAPVPPLPGPPGPPPPAVPAPAVGIVCGLLGMTCSI